MKKLRIGIFGATGMVGQEIIRVLHKRKFPVEELKFYASLKSKNRKLKSPYGIITVEDANHADYPKLDLAFYAIGGDWPKINAPKAIKENCIVIDNSSSFRYNKNVPLIIPEINPDAIGKSRLIANPNCTTAIAAIPLWEIYKKFGIKKIFISTYQAASGAGKNGIDELIEGTKDILKGKKPKIGTFIHQLPFNVIPQIDKFQKNDYTKEEMKVVWETRKIFSDDKLNISCTCVRVPTIRAHGETIVVETKKDITPNSLKKLFDKTDGIRLIDNPAKFEYPMPLNSSEKYDVNVGRIRRNLVFGKKGIEFFVVGDQILKGAALNAVQIAETLISQNRFE